MNKIRYICNLIDGQHLSGRILQKQYLKSIKYELTFSDIFWQLCLELDE